MYSRARSCKLLLRDIRLTYKNSQRNFRGRFSASTYLAGILYYRHGSRYSGIFPFRVFVILPLCISNLKKPDVILRYFFFSFLSSCKLNYKPNIRRSSSIYLVGTYVISINLNRMPFEEVHYHFSDINFFIFKLCKHWNLMWSLIIFCFKAYILLAFVRKKCSFLIRVIIERRYHHIFQAFIIDAMLLLFLSRKILCKIVLGEFFDPICIEIVHFCGTNNLNPILQSWKKLNK